YFPNFTSLVPTVACFDPIHAYCCIYFSPCPETDDQQDYQGQNVVASEAPKTSRRIVAKRSRAKRKKADGAQKPTADTRIRIKKQRVGQCSHQYRLQERVIEQSS